MVGKVCPKVQGGRPSMFCKPPPHLHYRRSNQTFFVSHLGSPGGPGAEDIGVLQRKDG